MLYVTYTLVDQKKIVIESDIDYREKESILANIVVGFFASNNLQIVRWDAEHKAAVSSFKIVDNTLKK